MEFHIDPQERFIDDPFSSSKIGHTNHTEDELGSELGSLSLEEKDDQCNMESFPPPPPTPSYEINYEVAPPSPFYGGAYQSPNYESGPYSPMENEDYLDPKFLNLKSPSKTQGDLQLVEQENDCMIIQEKTKEERQWEVFQILFNYLSLKVGVIDDPTPSDWQIIKRPLFVDLHNNVRRRRQKYAKAAPSKRSCKRLLLNKLVHPKIVCNIHNWDERVADFFKRNLVKLFNLFKSEKNSDFYKKMTLILYSALYAVYPANYQWNYGFSLSTTSLQPGDGSKSRYQMQKRQKTFNQMMEKRLQPQNMKM